MAFLKAGARPFFGSILLALLLLADAGAALPPPGEVKAQASDVKAAFLCNFAEFVVWPERGGEDGRVTIGILGDDPFGSLLDEAAAARSLPGRMIEVRRLVSADQAAGVAILFVGASEADRLSEILAALDHAPVLTVSDLPSFAAAGGMIGLKLKDKRIRLEINAGAAERAGLVISSRLLNLAELVDSKNGEQGGGG